MVQNSLVKLPTSGQWLLHSVGWTAGSVGGWALLACVLAANLPATAGEPLEIFLFGSAAALHLLLWLKAVAGGWQAVAARQNPPLLTLVLAVWLVELLVFQLLCVLLCFVVLAYDTPSRNS